MKYIAIILTAVFFFSNAQAITMDLSKDPVIGVKGLNKKRQEEMRELLTRISAAANESYKFFGFYPDTFEDLGLSEEFMKAMAEYKFDYFGAEDGFSAELQFGKHTVKVSEGDTSTLVR